jgi:predicted acylesterase/phospholipase RssA/CRP-like cAMP-binding protein
MRESAAVDQVATPRDLLACAPLLAGAEPDTLDDLARHVRPVRVQAGELVMREGEAADRLYLVRTGRLRVLVERDDGPRAVRELGPGAAIGELALLTGSARSATVQAIRDSELLELDAVVFNDVLDRDSGFAVSVARTLAFQLQASGELMPPPARPSTIAVSALDESVDAAASAHDLTAALALLGSVAAITRDDVGEDELDALDRAEREHDYVVLVDGGSDDRWSAFCARQADRHVVLAGRGGRLDLAHVPAHADLVVVERLPRQELAWLLDRLVPRSHHQLEDGSNGAGMERVARRLVGRALGVVLSGGGARGYAHIGAVEALEEFGFVIDRIGGCSMGAFIGGMHAAGFAPDEMRDRCRAELVSRSPFNDYTLPRVSLIRSRKAGRMLTRVFGDTTVEELSAAFFTVSADLLASRTVVHRRGPVWEAVGASMSIPGLVPPLSRPGHLLVDGGVLNNLPVDVMSGDDEGPIVAVDVIRRIDDVDESVSPPLPSIMETLSRATVLGSVERAERNRRLADLVVTPDVQDVALREFSALERAADAGRAAMRDALAGGAAESLRERLSAPKVF